MRFRAEAVNHARQLNGDVTRPTTATRSGKAGRAKKPSESIRIPRPEYPGGSDDRRWRSELIGRDGFAVYFQRFGINEAGKPLITSTLFLPSTFS